MATYATKLNSRNSGLVVQAVDARVSGDLAFFVPDGLGGNNRLFAAILHVTASLVSISWFFMAALLRHKNETAFVEASFTSAGETLCCKRKQLFSS